MGTEPDPGGDESGRETGSSGDDRAAGLRLSFERREPGLVGSFVPRSEHRGGPGLLHGGLAATALDETMAALGWVLDGVHCVTATLEVRYRLPVPLDGSTLTVEAWRERPEARRRQRVHGRLRLADGSVAVEASGIFVQVQRLSPGRASYPPPNPQDVPLASHRPRGRSLGQGLTRGAGR